MVQNSKSRKDTQSKPLSCPVSQPLLQFSSLEKTVVLSVSSKSFKMHTHKQIDTYMYMLLYIHILSFPFDMHTYVPCLFSLNTRSWESRTLIGQHRTGLGLNLSFVPPRAEAGSYPHPKADRDHLFPTSSSASPSW